VKLEINTTITFEHLLDSKQRVTHHIGGTRSGKSYGIIQYLIFEVLQTPQTITIVRKTIPSLKKTVMKDFKDIMQGLGLWHDESMNIADRIYTTSNGGQIQFINTDDPDKLRGLKSDILFIDEANEVDEDAYFQLSIRTTGKIILAYNPTISPYHWLRQMQDCERFTTSYRNNPYLPKEMVKSIEDLQHKNPKLWKIYGLGEYAANDKAIYQFEVVDDFDAEFVAFGLDWGYGGDELALVAVFKEGDNLYLEELIYEKGMVMKDIADRLEKLGINKSYEIFCDSSEPRSIEELYRYGFNAKPVKKGPDSIRFGISVLQNYKLHILKTSTNLINEMYGYQYSTDKHGYTTDTPESGLDHLLDAARYVAMMKLTQKAVRKGNYAITIR
jgi:phage terminase large subunit